MITIRHSLPKDLDAIIEIFHYARQFMKEHGNPNQWINGYPSAELILREITNGTNYVCENENGEIIGTFCFIPGEDPTYARIDDGNWLNNEPYYVIHRMATNGKQKGIADACFKWCFEHCNNIRVDTHHDNLVMQNILKKVRFPALWHHLYPQWHIPHRLPADINRKKSYLCRPNKQEKET